MLNSVMLRKEGQLAKRQIAGEEETTLDVYVTPCVNISLNGRYCAYRYNLAFV
jgi:hypothetical protein